MLFSELQKKKKKREKGKENGNLLFYQFIIPYYYDSLKNKKVYTPHVLHLPIYYIPFIYPLIPPILTTSIYSLILLQPYIYPFLLQ